MLQRLATWSSDTRFLLEEGSVIVIGRPVTGYPDTGGPATTQTGVLLTTDPELGEIDTPNGRVRFLQLVAVGAEELAVAQDDGAAAVIDRLRQEDPLMVTLVGP